MAKRNFTTLCVTTDFYNNNFQREKTRIEQLKGTKLTNTSFTAFLNKHGVQFKLSPQALKPSIPIKRKGFRCSI
jgi:hypothetical protein